MSIPHRVWLGMCWLDTEKPGWEKRINLQTLSMQDQRRCVLGQLYGQCKWRIDLDRFGFDAGPGSYEEKSLELWYLTSEWKRQIQLRIEK